MAKSHLKDHFLSHWSLHPKTLSDEVQHLGLVIKRSVSPEVERCMQVIGPWGSSPIAYNNR